MTDFTYQFQQFLRDNGYEPVKSHIESDKVQRAKYNGEKKSSARFSMKIEGDFAFGWVLSEKDPRGMLKWHAKTEGTKLTKEERSELARHYKEQKRLRDEQDKKTKAKLARRLTKVYKNLPLVDRHPYLDKKDVANHGVKYRAKGGELIIPLYNADNKVGGIQRITAKGWKGFFKGSDIQGCYFVIAKKGDDTSNIIICEGFATGASIYEATGIPVIVAFNTGNLKPAGERIRKKYPDSKIIYAADNDAFTFENGKKPSNIDVDALDGNDKLWAEFRETGLLQNPGIDKARDAAKDIAAHVIWPVFQDSASKPTDFNDLANLEGLDRVKEIIGQCFIDNVEQDGGASEPDIIDHGDDIPGHMDLAEHEASGGPSTLSYVEGGDFGHNFKVLGYNDGLYYYYPFGGKQIVSLSAKAHEMKTLIMLDSYEAWEERYGGKDVSDSKIALYAFNALHKRALERGVFVEEDRVRGCGVWKDGDAVILHAGDRVYVNGAECDFAKIDSKYTYVAAQNLLKLHPSPLLNKEAIKLRHICERITWENPLSGVLLAGWLVIAPICGALNYRPHIWVTGEAESGKSTLMDRIIKPILGDISLNYDGGTTEPAIRSGMGYDARPLVYDEAEKDRNAMVMSQVIDLMRKATTGSTVKKYGQKPFKARFAACMSGINPPVSKTADESRISFLVIKKNKKSTAIQDYDELMDMIDETITPEYSQRLLTRTITNIDALLKNIETFQRAVRKCVGGARASQQIGTMLAGLYLLSSTGEIEPDKAVEWVSKYDWGDHTSVNDATDPMRCFQYIMSAIIRWPKNEGSSTDISIGDLILEAESANSPESTKKTLRNYGVLVKDGYIYIANRNPNLTRILRDTDWSERWSRGLSDIEGAVKSDPIYFGPGGNLRAVGVPIDLIKDRAEIKPIEQIDIGEEIPF